MSGHVHVVYLRMVPHLVPTPFRTSRQHARCSTRFFFVLVSFAYETHSGLILNVFLYLRNHFIQPHRPRDRHTHVWCQQKEIRTSKSSHERGFSLFFVFTQDSKGRIPMDPVQTTMRKNLFFLLLFALFSNPGNPMFVFVFIIVRVIYSAMVNTESFTLASHHLTPLWLSLQTQNLTTLVSVVCLIITPLWKWSCIVPLRPVPEQNSETEFR